MDEERQPPNDASEPAPEPPSTDVPEERGIDLSEGIKGMVLLPTETAEPLDLQGVIDQVSPAPPPASGDSGDGGTSED
jgi:hypothetical protein